MNSTKKIYGGIDLFKLIASGLVVLLHAIETTDYFACGVKFVFTRFAVPFFFIVSGFFLYNGLERTDNKKKYIIEYEKHVASLYAIWGLGIYSCFEILTYFNKYSGESIFKILILIFRRLFVIGVGPFWYLLSLLITVPIIYFIYRKRQNWFLALLIILGLFLHISYSNFHGILSCIPIINYIYKGFYVVFSSENNFIMSGIPFMGIGYFIARSKIAPSLLFMNIAFWGSTLLRVIEYTLPKWFLNDFWNDNQVSVIFIIQAISFFLIAKKLIVLKKTSYSLLVRQLSSFVYFSHEFIMYYVLDNLLKINQSTQLLIYDPRFIIIKYTLTIAFCVFLFYWIKRINNTYLNTLINA